MKSPAISSLDWTPVVRQIESSSKFVLTTHVRPDTDGIGSEIALERYLRLAGKEVRILNSDPLPPHLRLLDADGAVRPYSDDDDEFARDATIIVLDVSERDRLGPLVPLLDGENKTSICIDHHINNGRRFATYNMIDPAAASTGVLVYDLLLTLGGEIDGVVAQALYATIVADTGCFRFSNTGSEVLRIAADLVDRGADPAVVARAVLGTFTQPKIRLLASALGDASLECDGRLIWYALSQAELDTAEATVLDTDGIIEYLRLYSTVRAAILLVELEPGTVKVSLRSEPGIDVNRLASSWGGGGHRHASGATLDTSLGAATEQVVSAARTLFDVD